MQMQVVTLISGEKSTMTTEKKLKKALELQQNGKSAEAEAAFKLVLRSDRSNFVSLYSLGVLAVQSGAQAKALQYFDRAVKVNPDFAPTWYNRGVVLHALDENERALESYDQALKVNPAYSEALEHRAILREIVRNAAETPVAPQPVPELAVQRNRALELQQQGMLGEAEQLFREILAVKPWDFVALYSLGVIAQRNGDPLQSLEFFDITARGNPDFAPIWYNRGAVLQGLKRSQEALESYDRALTLNPSYTEALVNRGAVLQGMNRHVEALENYDHLLQLEPRNDKALGNKGILLTEFKRFDEAAATFESLLEINPDYDYGLGLLCFAQMHSCAWDRLDHFAREISRGVQEGRAVSKTLALLAISDSSRDHLLCSMIFGRNNFPAQVPFWQGERYQHQKIRVAYLSPDFREHPVGHLTAGIFEHHDRSRFETIALSLGIDDQSGLRTRIAGSFDRFIDVREMNSRDIAKLMRSLEVDIAVDLAGYTADSRTDIFAWRPAPVQVNYLGYPSTLGLGYLDYIIADRFVIPEADQPHFSEKVVYLPDTYLPTDASLQVAERTPSREECGLPETGFVFCSFNHAYKINPAIFDVWMRILARTPESVLWLMKLNSSAEGNLRREAQARGIAPERLIFATRVPRVEDHLARYRRADLFLDTTPYNAHTTASDALFVGLPVLTCQGNAFPGRVAAGLLHAIGLPELVTGSFADYEEQAVLLAGDPERLGLVHAKLRANRDTTPLFDTAQFCRYLEGAYDGMWQRSQGGLPPVSFSVGKS